MFLSSADAKLANQYLQATAKYLGMYQQLLGPYAYQKFALVENFWETGFGMPSFTLLGSKVIRLPFILNSSYPHEILHNWWGNGVYVDYATGNWSEGLTAYLADHLIKQQQGQAVAYRQQALQKYSDYAAKNRDFSIAEFRGRHSSASEAVGYGKTLMMFHMLRNKLGDEVFKKSLRRLYQEYQFKLASFAELEQIFSAEYGSSLKDFFSQWVNRSGAPELALEGAKVSASNNSYLLEFNLQQKQTGKAYQLDIPLALTLEGKTRAHQQIITMTRKQQSFSIEVDAQPLRLDIDPAFDMFRKLDIQETPAAFTQVFGASELTVILPRQEEEKLKAAWQDFAQAMSHMGPETVDIIWDDEIEALPDQKAVAVLGWSNRFSKNMQQQLAQQGVQFDTDDIQNGLSHTPIKNHAFAWAIRLLPKGTDAEAVPRAWITADRPDALSGLGRKLPHYHKYSYMAFEGPEPQNNLKGRWPVSQSPMTVLFKPNTAPARLQQQMALIEAGSKFSQQRMLETINRLTDQSMQGRGFGDQGLDRAADVIAKAMAQAGLRPAGDQGSYFQAFTASGGQDHKTAQLKNVIGV
ncbi:MAG: M1 family aminopeptidase, partial [Gammaproteobacteria bacterium]